MTNPIVNRRRIDDLKDIAYTCNLTNEQARIFGKLSKTSTWEALLKSHTDKVTADRLTALELQVQALQESLEALTSELPGKLESGNFSELPNSDKVTDSELQIQLGNLRIENEALRQELAKERENYGTLVIISQQLNRQLEETRADYSKLLESSAVITSRLREEVQQLRSQLATERADREEIEAELSDLKQKSAPASELPEAADILNQLKARRKKSGASLADIEVILELLEG